MADLLSQAVSLYREEGALTVAQRAILYAYRQSYNRYWNTRYGSGVSILEKDWDNLLLLDACRYDEFLKIAAYEEESIDRRITVGSRTPEFLSRTFDDAQLHDTVYITANPQLLRYQFESEKNIFHDIISLLNKWDSETQTIKPELVRETALATADAYPNKRLLVHFFQPHAPFLGPTAAEIRRCTGKTIGGLNPGREYTEVESKDVEPASYEDILDEGVTPEEIRTAYRETLEIVLEECQQLVSELPGKTAITSDHGELLGERLFPFGSPQWEHPGDFRTTELCVVPWVEFETDERKRVTSEPPKEQDSPDDGVINKRLRALGYK